MVEEELYRVAGILHEARMTECYGGVSSPMRQSSFYKAWPSSLKDFRALRHAGTAWIDQAIAQAKAMEPYLIFPLSSKGRTADFDSANRGSNP